MSIEKIVEQCMKDGYLTPAMETEVGRICNAASELSMEEYMALDRLMAALLTGEIVVLPRKQFINVMEELVLAEAISRVGEIQPTCDRTINIADIAAYALNRLPPLYATTIEGANFQRTRAKEKLLHSISQKVSEAIARSIERPDFFPERQILGKMNGSEILDVLKQLLEDDDELPPTSARRTWQPDPQPGILDGGSLPPHL